MLLDRNDRQKAGELRLQNGSLEWSIFRSVQGTGSIDLTSGSVPQIDWMHDRVRITYHGRGGDIPFGVWLVSTTGWDTEGPITRTSLQLSDKTELLNWSIGEWFTLPAGTNVVQAVVDIITSRGETAILAEDSDATLLTAQTWDPTDGEVTWLKVVNDLLGLINYNTLWADLAGNLRLSPYTLPTQRPVVAAYGERPFDNLMTPNWSDEADFYRLPTGVRVHVEGDEETPGFVGRADLPPEHPLSAASRDGVPRLRVETREAATQAIADDIASRLLQESINVLRSVTLTHPVDQTQLNDVVLHRPTDLTGAIVNRSVNLQLGAVVEDRIRYNYTGGENLPWLS